MFDPNSHHPLRFVASFETFKQLKCSSLAQSLVTRSLFQYKMDFYYSCVKLKAKIDVDPLLK